MARPIIIFITAPKGKSSQKIARHLLKKKLAACVNIISGVSSLFWWEGKIDSAKEDLLVVKSCADRFKELISAVRQVHEYQVPEIIAFPIMSGNKAYLDWLKDTVSRCQTDRRTRRKSG